MKSKSKDKVRVKAYPIYAKGKVQYVANIMAYRQLDNDWYVILGDPGDDPFVGKGDDLVEALKDIVKQLENQG